MVPEGLIQKAREVFKGLKLLCSLIGNRFHRDFRLDTGQGGTGLYAFPVGALWRT